jgi:hypothetical protein
MTQTLTRPQHEESWNLEPLSVPLGFAAGDSNLYRYVGNRPTNSRDPSGLQELPPPSDQTSPAYADSWNAAGTNKAPFSFDIDAHLFQMWNLRLKPGEYVSYQRGCVGLASIRVSDSGQMPHLHPGARAFGSYQEAQAALAALDKAGTRGMLIAYQDTNPLLTTFPPIGTYPSSTEFDPTSLPLGDLNFASLVELYGTAYWEWIDSGWHMGAPMHSIFFGDIKDTPMIRANRDVHHCRVLPAGYHGKPVFTVYLVIPTARDIDRGRDGNGKFPRYRTGSPIYTFPPNITPPSINRPPTSGNTNE